MNIGILRETKMPVDRRVAITPEVANAILKNYPDIKIWVQPSATRVFTDDEYRELGIEVCEDLSHCDLLIGVKEVDKDVLLKRKAYLFFAHVAKEQPGNRALFQRMAALGCSLYDYEYFVDESSKRLIAFGYWAGLVGAYNALVGLCRKENLGELPLPQSFENKEEMYEFVRCLTLPNWRFIVTGLGRVGGGAIELLEHAGVRRVGVEEFCTGSFSSAVYCQLEESDYVERTDGKPFEKQHFRQFPELYSSSFSRFSSIADGLIVGHYWDPRAPRLFSVDEMRSEQFTIKMIADITCDSDGCVPCSLRCSTFDAPFYDYNPDLDGESSAFSSDRHVTIMAIDNLPNALPRDASLYFSKTLYDDVLPLLFKDKDSEIVRCAQILKDGKLTPAFEFLKDYLSSTSLS